MNQSSHNAVPSLGRVPHPWPGGNGRSPECQMPPERPQGPLELQRHINEGNHSLSSPEPQLHGAVKSQKSDKRQLCAWISARQAGTLELLEVLCWILHAGTAWEGALGPSLFLCVLLTRNHRNPVPLLLCLLQPQAVLSHIPLLLEGGRGEK